MKKTTSLLLLFIASIFIQATMPAYKIYNSKGKEINFEKMANKISSADVILFGELHNNSISHWLQFELTKALYETKGNKLLLGSEMFEADDQIKINEYFSNYITQKYFEKEARIWPNYKTDYKPPFEFAKEKKLKYIATNIPRRYASFVSTKGLDSLQLLSSEAKTFIAPLPIDFDPELPGYKKMAKMMRGHSISYLPQAQASKDATMAHFILKNLKEGQIFLHFNGAYHSNNHEGIYWYLKKQNKNLKIITITTIEQDDIKNFDDEIKNMADYFIVVDSDVTKTY
ncbi:MAG: ChaN family lipoprotein [Bacteroidota bacterium]|nr:ChaN family lipoprotein [Bacteroidota bacterium]